MSTNITFQRKEVLVDPYRLVYEDGTGDFSLTNLTGYISALDYEVADIAARNALSPSSGETVEVADASGDTAGYGTKRYYYNGEGWVLFDNVLRSEVALFGQALIHKTDGDITITPDTYDPESVTEFTFDYDEDGWYEIQVNAVRNKATLSATNNVVDIWVDGIANDLVWDAGANELQYIISAFAEVPPTIDYVYSDVLTNALAFSTSYNAQYTFSLEDFPYEYLCDCSRTRLDRYLDERTSKGLTETAKRYWDDYIDTSREKTAISFAISKTLYSEAQIVIERTQLNCAFLD